MSNRARCARCSRVIDMDYGFTFHGVGFVCTDCTQSQIDDMCGRNDSETLDRLARLERRVADLEQGRDHRSLWEAFEGRPAGDDERQHQAALRDTYSEGPYDRRADWCEPRTAKHLAGWLKRQDSAVRLEADRWLEREGFKRARVVDLSDHFANELYRHLGEYLAKNHR